MKKLVLALMLTLVSFCSAEVFTEQNLTPDEVAQLKMFTENMKLKSGVTKVDDKAEKLKSYAQVGEAVAKALGAAAKEMNVAVNDFAQSPVGKITTVLIVWKVAGKDILKTITGFFLLITSIIAFIWGIRKTCFEEEVHGTPPVKTFTLMNNCGTQAIFCTLSFAAVMVTSLTLICF